MMGLYKKPISSFFFFFLHLMTSHDGFHVIFSFRSSFQIHGHSTQCPGFTQCCVVPPHPGAVVLMGLCLFSIYFPLSHIRFFHFSSIQWVSSFSCLVDCAIAMSCPFSSFAVMSDSLRLHGLQHARFPCPSPTPGACSNSCPSSQWCHPTISSSAVPFSSHLQSFPASGSFQMSQFFTSGDQSTGVSASASVLPMNTQDWSPLGWTAWISLQSKRLSGVFSTPQFKSINSSVLSLLHSPTLTSIHDYWKNHSLD